MLAAAPIGLNVAHKETRSHGTIAKGAGLAKKAKIGQGLGVFMLQDRPKAGEQFTP
jgi:hypothetical protein